MLKKIQPYYPHLMAIGAGMLLVTAFAPFRYASLAFVAPAILLRLLHRLKPKKGFLFGTLFGLGFFGFGASWIFHSIYVFGGTPMWLAGIITGLFVVYLALFHGAQAYLLLKYFPEDNLNRIAFGFPVIWVAGEILRGWLFTGFPWLYLGYSQTGNIMRSLSSLGGVWLVSWAVLFISGLCYRLYIYIHDQERTPKKRNIIIAGIVCIWPIAYFIDDIPWSQPVGDAIPVSLVQGNVPQLMRWDPQAANGIIAKYYKLSEPELGPRLIVWPEGAIPVPLPQAKTLLQQLHDVSIQNDTALIVGLPEQTPNNNEQYYNSLVGLGQAQGAYRKEHLVPFGEYVPFEFLLRGLINFFDLPMSQFVPFPEEQAPMTALGAKVGSAICYEIAYTDIVRDRAKDAHVILTVSNDAWFGRTFGPPQHLQIARMRAIETGRYIIRATNNGITAVINPNGVIKALLPQFVSDVLEGEFTPMSGKTPWVLLGIWPWLPFYGFCLGFGYWRQHLAKKKPRG